MGGDSVLAQCKNIRRKGIEPDTAIQICYQTRNRCLSFVAIVIFNLIPNNSTVSLWGPTGGIGRLNLLAWT